MPDEAKILFRGVHQDLSFLTFLGLSTWTTPPHPQPGWSPDTRRQPHIVPCCRSMHSGASSAVSRDVMEGRSVTLGWNYRVTALGTVRAVTEAILMAHSAPIRTVPKLAASTKCDLPGSADSRRCL